MSDHTFWTIAFTVWVYLSMAALVTWEAFHNTRGKLFTSLTLGVLWLPAYAFAYSLLIFQRVTRGQR